MRAAGAAAAANFQLINEATAAVRWRRLRLPRNSQEADAAGHRGYMKAPGGAHLAENAAEN